LINHSISGSFQTKLFGWKGTLSDEQTATIASSKQVIYDGFKAAIAGRYREFVDAFEKARVQG
jgi:hypothetical protein